MDTDTPAADLSIAGSEMRVTSSNLFSLNETITTPKLADRLMENDGEYLGLMDEIEGLFESLEGKSREVLDRRFWLSLNTGSSVTRSTSKKVSSLPATRLNYTGE